MVQENVAVSFQAWKSMEVLYLNSSFVDLLFG